MTTKKKLRKEAKRLNIQGRKRSKRDIERAILHSDSNPEAKIFAVYTEGQDSLYNNYSLKELLDIIRSKSKSRGLMGKKDLAEYVKRKPGFCFYDEIQALLA